jgi:hypothetical protein
VLGEDGEHVGVQVRHAAAQARERIGEPDGGAVGGFGEVQRPAGMNRRDELDGRR